MPLEVMGRQMPLEVIGASNATQGLLGRQMPPRGIGASNATVGLYGSQRPHGRQKAGVRDQGSQGSDGGLGVKIRASGFTASNGLGVKGDESSAHCERFGFTGNNI